MRQSSAASATFAQEIAETIRCLPPNVATRTADTAMDIEESLGMIFGKHTILICRCPARGSVGFNRWGSHLSLAQPRYNPFCCKQRSGTYAGALLHTRRRNSPMGTAC